MKIRNRLTPGLLLLGPVFLGLLILFQPAAAGPAGSGVSLTDTVRSSLESFVRERITMPFDSVAVLTALPAFPVKSHEVLDFSLDLLSTRPVQGTVPVKVTLILNDGTTLGYAATARVRAYANLLVAAERLDRHETISAAALRVEKREITNLADAYFTDPAEIAGKRATRVLAPGTILKASEVEMIPLVDRGAGVTVSVVLNTVTVTSKAKALEDGDLGELIKVQDITTGKRLVGTVVGKGQVILDESVL